MNIRLFYTFLFVSFISTCLDSQKSYVTASGQSIVVYPNGNWEYADFNHYNSDDNLFSENSEEVNPYEIPVENKYILSDSENELLLDLKTQLLYYEIDFFVKHIIAMQNNEVNDRPTKDEKKLEKDLKNKYERATILLNKLKKVYSEDLEGRENTFLQVRKAMEKYFGNENDKRSLLDTKLENERKARSQLSNFELDNRVPHEIQSALDCQVIFNGYDRDIDMDRKELKSAPIFNYTHPKLMSHFKDKNFLSANAAIMKVGKEYFLDMRITIASRNAKKSYGAIEDRSMIRISLINGRKIFSQSIIKSVGKIEAYTGNTIYQTLYELDGDHINELKNKEIDKIGIMWSTGFEDYTVFEVDFFQKQITCLENDQ